MLAEDLESEEEMDEVAESCSASAQDTSIFRGASSLPESHGPVLPSVGHIGQTILQHCQSQQIGTSERC